jgi:hypothetical protein
MASQSTLDILSKCKFENPVAFATTKKKNVNTRLWGLMCIQNKTQIGENRLFSKKLQKRL